MKRRFWIVFLLLFVLLLSVSVAAAEDEGEPADTTEETADAPTDTGPTEETTETPTEAPTPTPSKEDDFYLHFLQEKDEVAEKSKDTMNGILDKIRNFIEVNEADIEKLPGWLRTGYTTFLVCGVCLIPISVIFGIFLYKSHKDNRKWAKRGILGFCVVVPLVITFLLIGIPGMYIFFNRGL